MFLSNIPENVDSSILLIAKLEGVGLDYCLKPQQQED